jgi:hypothetical protein
LAHCSVSRRIFCCFFTQESSALFCANHFCQGNILP